MKCISFDIWNTLLDLGKLYRLVAVELSNITGKSEQDLELGLAEAYKKALQLRLEGSFKNPIIDSAGIFASALGISIDSLFRALVRAIMREEIGKIAFEDAREALEQLSKHDIDVGALGNVMFWPGMVTRYILEKNGLLSYLHATIFTDELGVQKPDRAAFELISDKLGCSTSQLVHVGDSLENDFAGALLSGASAILVKRDLEKSIAISKKAYIVNSLTEIPQILPLL